MTSHLAATGTPVYAIEIDSTVARRLKHLTEQYANLTIVSGDVLKTDIAKLAGGRRVHVYGNLPYYITSPILHHLFRFAEIIDEVHIVIQTEVAERLAAEPDGSEYGYLSVATRLYSRPEFVFKIPRGAFLPPPDVSVRAGDVALSRRKAGDGRCGKRGVSGVREVVFFAETQNTGEQSEIFGAARARSEGAVGTEAAARCPR